MDTQHLLSTFTENPGMYHWNSSVWGGSRFGHRSWRDFFQSEHDHFRNIDRAADQLERDIAQAKERYTADCTRLFAQHLPAQEAYCLPDDLNQLAKALWKTRTKKRDAQKTGLPHLFDTITLHFTRTGVHVQQWELQPYGIAETGLTQTAPMCGDTFQATINRTAFYELTHRYLDKQERVDFRLPYKGTYLEMKQADWRSRLTLQAVQS